MQQDPPTVFYSLKTDLLFHMVFTKNQKALTGLTASLLNIPEKSITKIEILNSIQYSEEILSKQTVLDLKLHLSNKRYVLIEMQVRRFTHWTNRTLTYSCRQIIDQVKDDFSYDKLEQVIQVAIMDHTLFPDHPRFFAKYAPRDEEGYQYTDKLQFYVLDLTQIGAATAEQAQQGLVEWAKMFRATSWEEVKKIEDPNVKEAAKTMEFILSDPTERELIRAMIDAEIDQRTLLSEAREEGRAEGRTEGMSEGRAEGMAEGRAQGIAEGKTLTQLAYARAMKADGLPLDKIALYSGLSIEEIEKL